MPLTTVRNDITKINTDAIVLPANRWLEQGSGTSRAIYMAAGEKKLQGEIRLIYPDGCPLGEAVITCGYGLDAKYIIHAVCPKWHGGRRNEGEYLYNAYANSLKLALEQNLKSISFPLLSAGNYGCPKDHAMAVANQAITDFLLLHDMDVYLVLYTDDAVDMGSRIFTDIRQYIDSRYVEEKDETFESEIYSSRFERFGREDEPELTSGAVRRELAGNLRTSEEICKSLAEPKVLYEKRVGADTEVLSAIGGAVDFDNHMKQKGESFHDMLMRLIDESGMKGPDIYDRALMSKQLYSKIKNDPYKQLKKKTILSLAIALKLGISTTQELLMKAGYALSDSSEFDLAVSYFLEHEDYDIDAINIALERLGIGDYFGYN